MRWKWILGICACLIVVLMAGVYVFLRAYDYNKLKPRIARMVKEATGRELNLGGDINLAFGFSPVLVVTDITFANAPWASQPKMLKIDGTKHSRQQIVRRLYSVRDKETVKYTLILKFYILW